jgi:hypothetical protein
MSNSINISETIFGFTSKLSEQIQPIINNPIVVSLTIVISIIVIIAIFDVGFKSVTLMCVLTAGYIFAHDYAHENKIKAVDGRRGGAIMAMESPIVEDKKESISLPTFSWDR